MNKFIINYTDTSVQQNGRVVRQSGLTFPIAILVKFVNHRPQLVLGHILTQLPTHTGAHLNAFKSCTVQQCTVGNLNSS
jgi:hypothetical protein